MWRRWRSTLFPYTTLFRSEELDLATTGFETRGNLRQAQDLGDEILRLDPNSVRHRQKQVEFAFKSGDKAKLIRSEEHTSELQSHSDLVCRLLLEKKKNTAR